MFAPIPPDAIPSPGRSAELPLVECPSPPDVTQIQKLVAGVSSSARRIIDLLEENPNTARPG